ncbi:MAG: matrixin family metalloprotease [Solirubrobacteraceae bacterium]|nr:matrixin family metalloprotease [Solirubrobacteraceae bacterium]
MLSRSLLPTLLTALALAAPAAAAPALDADTGPYTNPPTAPATTPVSGSATANPLVAKLWAAAVRYWGGAPASCASAGVSIRLSTEDPEATGDADEAVYNGWVYDDDLCTMYLNVRNESWPIRARNAELWCQIITHEAGHMLGLSHSRNKRHIMYEGWIPNANPHCRAFRPKARSTRRR